MINRINGKIKNDVINWVIFVIVARCIFLLIYQGLLAYCYSWKNDPSPWESASQWWTVYGTLVDISCLILIIIGLNKEGQTFSSLLDFDKTKILSDLKNGLIIFVLIFPLIGFIYSTGVARVLLNEKSYDLISGQLALRTLPS